MKNKYIDLIEQTFEFPQDEFSVQDNELNFHDIPLMDIIKQYVHAAQSYLFAENHLTDPTGQATVQRSNGEGRLPGFL